MTISTRNLSKLPDIGALKHLMQSVAVLVAKINPDLTLADLKADLAEIGYPNPPAGA